MKNVLYLLMIIFAVNLSNAENNLVQDRVITGPGYVNDVIISLHTGVQTTIDAKNWDLGFEISGGFGYAVINNGGNGNQVYHKPGVTAEDFDNTYQLSEIESDWQQIYNSTSSWSNGSFNTVSDPSNENDLGWGEYNMSNHYVNATTFFVIKTIAGNWKKIIIDGLVNRKYSFRIANLDGTNMIEKSISKDDFPGVNFAYYSIDNDELINREPKIADWDLYFGKYMNLEQIDPPVFYSVSGVRTNPKIKSIRVTAEFPEETAAPDTSDFDFNITNIGSNWKSFEGSKYVINDKLAFFVYHTVSQKTFHIVFNGFEGSSTGVYLFKQDGIATSISDDKANPFTLAIYPSIAHRSQTVSLLTNLEINNGAVLEVLSSNGNIIFTKELNSYEGFNNIDLNTDKLSTGLYLVSIRTNSSRITQKLIIE